MGEEQERTLFCANVDSQVTDRLLYELFLQAGPVERVSIIDKKNIAFITFKHVESVEYTIKLMDGIRLFNRCLQLKPRQSKSASRQGNYSGNASFNSSQSQSPHLLQRSFSSPQYQSTPIAGHAYHHGRMNDRSRDSPSESRDSSRSDHRHRDRHHERDRDRSRDRDYQQDRPREKSRERSHERGDRHWDTDRSGERERSRNDHNRSYLDRSDTYPLSGIATGGGDTFQSTTDQQVEFELRRRRILAQQQQQLQFNQQMAMYRAAAAASPYGMNPPWGSGSRGGGYYEGGSYRH